MLFKKIIFQFLGILAVMPAMAQNVFVEHPSPQHTMVKVTSGQRFVLLPIQESADEMKITVLSAAKFVETLDVHLAKDTVDYFVPLDLSATHGRKVILDILPINRSIGRDNTNDLCWTTLQTSDEFRWKDTEYYRPKHHYSPKYGWMNDPNGMFYKDGEWHLYFQYNPYACIWGNMTWGHAVSTDLVHWTQKDNAILPDGLGTIFSGSCIIDKNNDAGFGKDAIIAMYTSAAENQTQSLAYSLDGGNTFEKYEDNPVIISDVIDFRDPKMFFCEKTNDWKVVLAVGQHVEFYSSKNLKDWKYESSFGQLYGNHNGVWECPDLVKLPFEGGYKYVLLLNINPGGPFGGSATQYFVGEYDGHTFVCDDECTVTRWMDYGKDHYAAVTFSNAPDNRVIAMAWMSNWQYAQKVPSRQFRSSCSVARELSLQRKGKEVILVSKPVEEFKAIRGEKKSFVAPVSELPLFHNPQDAYEIELSFVAPKSGAVKMTLGNSKAEFVEMRYDTHTRMFVMKREFSGIVKFSKQFPATTYAPTKLSGKMSLRLIVDKTSLEAFGDDFAMTNLVFPSEQYNVLTIDSPVKVDVNVYPLN